MRNVDETKFANRLWIIMIAAIILLCFLASSCSNTKRFVKKDGTEIIAEPYGWADADKKKHPDVVYEVSWGDVCWSILASETAVVPIWLTGWRIMQPVELKENLPLN